MPKFSILAALIAIAVFACILGAYSPRLREAIRIDYANRQYYAQIFRRCHGIAELRQFVELYNPESALEFFDNDRVVSVACVAHIDDRYTASFTADVQINEEGIYELTGAMRLVIDDRDGKFTVIESNSTSSGQSVRLNPNEWAEFIAGGADIESIRTINRTGTFLPNPDEP